MGIRLIVEVLDHAPVELTAVDRLLLVVIAENANDKTREGYPGWELIARRMRWSGQKDGGKNAVSTALANLARRGVEVRVPIGKTKDTGAAVYAAHGHRTTYRVPPLRRVAETATHEGLQPLPPNGDGEGWQSQGSKGGNPKGRRVAETATPSPQEPSKNPQQRDASDPTTDDKTAVLAEIRRRKPDASPALIQHIYRQDGPTILAELHEQADRDRIARWLAWADTQPPCDPVHAIPGGNLIRPDTREPRCAGCRARHRRITQEAS